MQPRISVVIPTQNTRDVTLAALASLDRQSRALHEIIVVDDGSEDGTAEAVASAFPHVRRLRNDAPLGFSGAANRGAGASSGDLIWLLNSDTVVDPGGAEAVASGFQRDEKLGIAGATLSYPDGTPQWSGGPFPGLPWLFALASGLPRLLAGIPLWRTVRPVSGTSQPHAVDWVTGAAMVVRRRVWESVGPLREDYRFYCQDLDLCWQATREGWQVRVLPDVRVVHAHGTTMQPRGDDSEPLNPEYLWPDLVRYFRLNHGRRSAERARRTLLLGGWLRVLARGAAAPLRGLARRRGWRDGTRRYRSALRALHS